jgi:type IV pilus assembly protein PilM
MSMDTLLHGKVIQDRYRITELVAKKGWVNHYRAESVKSKEKVFIKEIHDPSAGAAEEVKERHDHVPHAFFKTLLSLEHDHIMHVIDHLKEKDRHFVIMENLCGTTLFQISLTWGSTEDEILRIARQICDALLYLHHLPNPFIVRCLSADNIIVQDELQAKIIDLGITSFFSPLVKEQVIMRPHGVPGYASPEEYGTGKLDARADIYSFGALLYFLYTRKTPPESIDLLLGNEALAVPSRIRKNINPNVEAIILKALSPGKDDRYNSFMEVEKALREATEKTWSAIHLPHGKRVGEPSASSVSHEDIASLEPFVHGQEWIINKFRKNEIGILTPLGLDIGSEYIKLAALEKSKEGLNVSLLAKVPTPLDHVSAGSIKKPAELSVFLRNWLDDKNFDVVPLSKKGFIEKLVASAGMGRRNCVVLVGGPELYIRGMETEYTNPDEIKYQAQLQMADIMPFRVEDARIETVIAHKEGKKHQVLIFAVSKNLIETIRSVIQSLNMNLLAIDFEPFALFRAIKLMLGNESLTKTLVLLNIGSEYSSLIFYGKGVVRHSRVLNFGGAALSRRLSEAMDISFHKVERLKREHVMLPNDGVKAFPSDFSESLFKIIEPSLRDFAKDLKKTFTYFSRMHNEKKIDLLFLTGGGALLKNLDRFFKQELEISVVLGNVFRNLIWTNIPEGPIQKPDSDFTSFASCLGSACYESMHK